MPSKFLVGKKFTSIGSNREVYMGIVFVNELIYYPHIIQLFNGIDFTNKQQLNITKRVESYLFKGHSLEDAIQILKKELEYEKRLYDRMKNHAFYYSIVDIHSKPNVTNWVKAYATNYFLQVKYYLEQNPEDYSNERIELINGIIANTSENIRLWRKIEENLKLKV